MQITRMLSSATLSTVACLVAGLIWLIGVDTVADLAASLDLISASDAVGYKDGKFLPLLVATCIFVYFSTKQRHQANASASAHLRLIANSATNGVAFADSSGVIRFTNPSFLRLLGLSRGIEGGAPVDTLIGPYVTEHCSGPVLPDQGEVQHVLRVRSKPGDDSEIAVRARRFDAEGEDGGWILTAFDLTADRQESTTKAIQLRALETATDGVAVANVEMPDMPLIYVNKAFEEITGYTAAEILGRNCRYLQGSDRQQPEIGKLREAIQRRQPATVTLRNYRKDGAMFWSEIRLAPVVGDGGLVSHYVAIIRDVTQLRESTSKFERLAYYDADTSLPNRAHFSGLLTDMLANAEHAVLLIRLDIIRFNEVVGCFGEDAGYQLLTEVGRRLRVAVPTSIVGLVNGNEFSVAVPIDDLSQVDLVVAHVRAALSPQFQLSGSAVQLFFAIGTAVGTHDATTTILMRQALIALIRSKRTRIGAARGFDADSEDDMRRRVRLTNDLQQAVTNRDFELHYQPRVELASGAILGAEALIWWRHPVFGLQPPSRFIPVAEQTSHIIEMGTWALHEAARFAATINHGRQRPLTFSVNVSPVQFQHDDIASALRAALLDTGADPSWITLEVTEFCARRRNAGSDGETPRPARHGFRDCGG